MELWYFVFAKTSLKFLWDYYYIISTTCQIIVSPLSILLLPLYRSIMVTDSIWGFMSFLSKMEQASHSPSHFHSILVLLGGFFPLLAPCFAIFIGMLLHPFLSSYKTTGCWVDLSSKNCQYAVILLGFGLNISQVLRSWAIFTPCHPVHHFNSLIVAYLSSAFALDTKPATGLE